MSCTCCVLIAFLRLFLCFPASRGPFSFVFAEFSEYEGKEASASREFLCYRPRKLEINCVLFIEKLFVSRKKKSIRLMFICPKLTSLTSPEI